MARQKIPSTSSAKEANPNILYIGIWTDDDGNRVIGADSDPVKARKSADKARIKAVKKSGKEFTRFALRPIELDIK